MLSELRQQSESIRRLAGEVKGLAKELREGAVANTLTLSLAPDEKGRLALGVGRGDLSVHHTAHLSPEEFDALAAREGVAAILERQGIRWT